MAEAISQHKLMAMGKPIPQTGSSPSASNKSVKEGGKSDPKPAAKNY